MSRNLLVALTFSIVAVCCAGAFVYWNGLPWADETAQGADGEPAKRTEVIALGRLEPKDGIHGVGAIPGDVLDEVKVHVGQAVSRGEVVAVLKSRGLRRLEAEAVEKQLQEAIHRSEAEESAAKSRIELAELAVKQAEAGANKLASQKKQIELLETVFELEKKRFENLQGLSKETVSANERQTQELLVRKSEAELFAAQASFESLQLANRFAIDTAVAEVKAAESAKELILAGLSRESLQKRYEQALAQYELTNIKSPVEGVVLGVFARSGEVVGPLRIMTVADVSKMVCRADVYQNDIKHLRAALKKDDAGIEVKITSAALEQPYDEKGLIGRVKSLASIGRMVSPPVTDPTDPFARADVEIVQVEIELEGEYAEVASRYVNLQVNVSFAFPEGIPPESPRMNGQTPTERAAGSGP
jgi:HlyD family secretion protein